MKIVMVSNYLNHHQLPVCNEFARETNNNFVFVSTSPMGSFRKDMGYLDLDHICPFVVRAYDNLENKQLAQKHCKEADILIIGHMTKEFEIPKLNESQTVFFCSERVFKGKGFDLKNCARFIKYLFRSELYKDAYLLCASAYAAHDYNITHNFRNRTFKWGYFTETKVCSLDQICEKKNNEVPHILWVGRFLKWKHPELIIQLANHLNSKNIKYHIDVIGSGELEEMIKKEIKDKGLEPYINLVGSVSNDQVREYMLNSNIFLFTSDSNEGWGAVLNEAMNSACAIISCIDAGSTPFLINERNGRIYKNGDIETFLNISEELICNKELSLELGINAYNTIANTWNEHEAVRRLLLLTESLKDQSNTPFNDGPCSKCK